MQYEMIKVKPVTARIGAEIEGIDLTKPLEQQAFREVHQALKDHEDEVRIDLGLGRQPLPVQPECEARRTAIGRELSSLDRDVRRRIAGMLEPVGAWHALTLPPVLEEMDTSDPRSL